MKQTTFDFTIKVKCTGTYDADLTYKPEQLIKLKAVADRYLKKYNNDLKKLFKDMMPLEVNPPIDLDIDFSGVDDDFQE